MSFDLHDGDEDDQHDDGLEEAQGHQHHTNRDDAGRQRADDRHEREDEGQGTDRDRHG